MDDFVLSSLLTSVGNIVAFNKAQERGYSVEVGRLITREANFAYNTLIHEEMNRADNCFPGEPILEPEWMAEDTQLHLEHISNLSRDEEARALPEPIQVFWL